MIIICIQKERLLRYVVSPFEVFFVYQSYVLKARREFVDCQAESNSHGQSCEVAETKLAVVTSSY